MGRCPAINITVNGLNGFTSTVQITLSALPTGVISNPASPLAVAAGATVPILIGAAATVSASGGTTVTIRGSDFQSATAVSINGKPASVAFKSVNPLTVVTTSLTAGPQRITITNPDGEAIALEAALTANWAISAYCLQTSF